MFFGFHKLTKNQVNPGELSDPGVSYHSLRSRQAAARKFIAVHWLVPGDWTIRGGHQLAEQIAQQVMKTLPYSNIVTHIEPIEDPISLADRDLDRGS